MGLGWVYETVDVFSTYLQEAVAEMSNTERESRGVVRDFTKIPESQLKKVVKLIGKRQGSFLYLNKPSSSIEKTLLGRTTWIMSNTSSTVMYNFGVGPRFAFVSASARAPK
jgi:hypothetical protein